MFCFDSYICVYFRTIYFWFALKLQREWILQIVLKFQMIVKMKKVNSENEYCPQIIHISVAWFIKTISVLIQILYLISFHPCIQKHQYRVNYTVLEDFYNTWYMVTLLSHNFIVMKKVHLNSKISPSNSLKCCLCSCCNQIFDSLNRFPTPHQTCFRLSNLYLIQVHL